MSWARVLLLVLLAWWVGTGCHTLAAEAEPAEPPYDLLLRGGHVIDPAHGIDEPRDVAVADQKVAAVERVIDPSLARRVVDVTGLIVTPGLIDLHAHCVVGGNGRWGFPPDMYFASGVTTVVDAGTYGAENFDLLKRHVMEKSEVRILAMLNIVATGMVADEQDVSEMDPALCATTIKKHPELLVGVKTAHYWTHQPFDDEHPPWAAVDRALEAGELADVPIMVDFWPRPPERPYAELILEKLRPGDIHTHVFAQQFPIVDAERRLYPHLKKARERGVFFDLGHGAGSFWFRNAVPAIQQGFVPDTISTDLHSRNVNGPVFDMATTLSKCLAMGISLEDVIRRSTVNPARLIRRPELGTLGVGREADVAVFKLRRGRFGYVDCGQTRIVGNVKLESQLTLRSGGIVYDPTGLGMAEWENAPAQYFTTPKLQNVDPPAYADPDRLRIWELKQRVRTQRSP